MDLFSDYTYTPGDETIPDPGTSSGGGFNWEDFINGVVRGTTEIIAVSRQPTNTLPYRQPTYPTSRTPAGSSDMLPLILLGVVVVALLLK